MASLYGMLTDVQLMQDQCLLLNGPTPYSDPETKPKILDDFNTGSRYIDSHFHLKQDDIDYPLGLIHFIDASVYDKGDRLSTEMVAFTISLLNRETRNKPHSWRSLGSIPNFKHVDHKSADEKIKDYHLLLYELLRDIHFLQRKVSGILWPLMFGGKFYMIRIRPYILCVLGDTPGQNTLAGKMKGPKAKRLCRYCNIPKAELSNPWFNGKLTTRLQVMNMQGDPERLRALSYKKVDNAWRHLDFGGCQYGIHGCVPGEIVHALQHGIMPMVTDGLFFTKALTAPVRDKNRRKKAKELKAASAVEEPSINDKDVVLKDIPEEEIQKKEQNKKKLLKNGVFGGQLGLEVCHISRRLGREGQHQSDRDLPPINFALGITTRSKTTASEQQGIAFLTTLILCSTYALNKGGIGEKIGEQKMAGYINILEQLICLEELLKTTRQKGIRRSHIPALRYYTCVLLDTIKQVVDRQQGDGFDTIKFHLLVHMIDLDVRRYASPANISGSAGECQFKDNFKLQASTTQMRALLLDQQLYERRYQHMFITRCSQRVGRANGLADHLTKESSTDNSRAECESSHFSSGLFKRMEGVPETEGDIANTRFSDGLSGLAYTVQMVKNNKMPEEQYLPDIVYCGRTGTRRHKHFFCANTNLIGLDGKPAGAKNCRGLKVFNSGFGKLFRVFEPLLHIQPDLKILIFTEFRKDNKLYRADPCSPHSLEGTEKFMTRSWCDWAHFKDKVSPSLYPGQILGFTSFETEAVSTVFNQTCEADNNVDLSDGSGYAVAELTSRELVGYLDPTANPIPQQQMQANSSLFFWEEKETVSDSGLDKRTTKGKRGKAKSSRANKPKQHRVRLLSVSRIRGPVVAFADFAPQFEHTNGVTKCGAWVPPCRFGAYIFVRPRSQWSRVFLSRARQAYAQHLLERKDSNIIPNGPTKKNITSAKGKKKRQPPIPNNKDEASSKCKKKGHPR
jgi:hypothetical protein